MEVQLHTHNDVSILTIRGRVDSHTIPTLRHHLDLIAMTKPANLVINLADVDFMDSSGLATLVYGMKRCREREGDLYLCNTQQPVRMILELTRLDKALEIFPNQDDAIASFHTIT